MKIESKNYRKIHQNTAIKTGLMNQPSFGCANCEKIAEKIVGEYVTGESSGFIYFATNCKTVKEAINSINEKKPAGIILLVSNSLKFLHTHLYLGHREPNEVIPSIVKKKIGNFIHDDGLTYGQIKSFGNAFDSKVKEIFVDGSKELKIGTDAKFENAHLRKEEQTNELFGIVAQSYENKYTRTEGNFFKMFKNYITNIKA